jgi:general secretion pathway protein M
MERIRTLLADAQGYLAAASQRERRLIGLMAAGITAFLLMIIWVGFGRSIRKHEDGLEEKRGYFEKVQKLSAGFGREEQERQLLETRLRQSPPALMGFVDGLAKQDGVEIGGMSDRGIRAVGDGHLRESSVEANLGKVSLDKLMRLLQDIERSPGVVRVRRLHLRKSSDNKETLDVTLTVSAWQGA